MNWSKVRNGDMFGTFGPGKLSVGIKIFQKIVCRRQGIKVPKGKYPSHVGVIQRTRRDIRFIEALMGSGITVSPFSKYADKDIEIYRFTDLAYTMPEAKQRKLFVEKMLGFEGAEYDFLGLLGIFLYALGLPFGVSFNDNKRLYCSESLGQAALAAAYLPFFPLAKMRGDEKVPIGLFCPIHIPLSSLTFTLK